ncbi:MAG: HlyD family type I secretion periplasmic adaptor subunit [Acetobacteraceae bacterium]|nr:HlyD family type I secretion periplasmic adaptor subunit [Acetobacteraceae bacterium]
MSNAVSPHVSIWTDAAQRRLPQASLRRLALLTLLTIGLGLGSVLAWACLATVESAVPATGVVITSGKRKTMTLLESGILHELLVHEGDRVLAGQTLLRLDDVQVKAARDQAKIQFWSATAKLARLNAEASDQRELVFSDALEQTAADDPAVAAAILAERRQFVVRWSAFDSSVQVQQRKIAQSQAQIGAIRAQIASLGTKLSLLREELQNVEYLLARGLQTKPHQLELRRAEADARGSIGQLANQLTQAEQLIAQTEFETQNAAETRHADISRDRTDTQATIADTQQRLIAANDQLAKRDVLAPEDGVITDLRYFTIGSSITAGQPIMDLVPTTSHLLIEGNVAPNEVEHLSVGQKVNIRLSAYKAHRVPVLTGVLTYVGGDRQMDGNNQPFFLLRAELDPGQLADKPGVVLLPGMPADILVINGRRSVMSFLISPITDSMFHSMREE